MQGASYITPSYERLEKANLKPRKSRKLVSFFAIFAILFSVLGMQPLIAMSIEKSMISQDETGFKKTFVEADAFGVCANPKTGGLGTYMDGRPAQWRTSFVSYPGDDTKNRYLTLQEAAGRGVVIPTFDGAGTKEELGDLGPFESMFVNTDGLTQEQINTAIGVPLAESSFSKFKEARSGSTCFWTPVGKLVSNMSFGVIGVITDITSGISSMAFNPNIICSDPNKPNAGCFNILSVIGGDNTGNDGIIGNLTNSIYFPLLAICAIITGVWVVWVGVAKQQFTKALQGALWTVISVVLGVTILSMPQVLAKAPMFINNEIVTVLFSVYGAGSSGGSEGKANFCNSAGDNKDRLEFATNNMNCQIWKAFVLEPYAQASFGTNLNNLNVGSSTQTAADKAIAAAGLNANDFCYNLKTTKSLKDQETSTLTLAGTDNQLCNLAAAQIITGVNLADGSKAPPAIGNYDTRWLKLSAALASDDAMWTSWSGTNWFVAFSYSFIAFFTTIAATLVIIVISFFALIFYLTSILMMVLAPFFLLIGIVPGRGRRILMTWVQLILSNIMKYMASAIFLVITVAIYAGVLSQLTNVGMTAIFVVILTGALLLYRKEIVNLLGKVELGAENITNKAGGIASRLGDRTKQAAGAAVGASAGAVLANGVVNPLSASSIRESLTAGAKGAKDGVLRSVKSKNDFLGNTVRANELYKHKKNEDLGKKFNNLKDESSEIALSLSEQESIHATADADITAAEAKMAKNNKYIVNNTSDIDAIDMVKEQALYDFSDDGIQTLSPEFAKWQEIIDQANNLRIKADVQMRSGDVEGARSTQSEVATLDKTAQYLRETTMDDEDFFAAQAIFRERVEEGYERITNNHVDYSQLSDRHSKYYDAALESEALEAQVEDMQVVKATAGRNIAEISVEKEITEASRDSYEEIYSATKKTGISGRAYRNADNVIQETMEETRDERFAKLGDATITPDDPTVVRNVDSNFAKERIDSYNQSPLDVVEPEDLSSANAHYEELERRRQARAQREQASRAQEPLNTPNPKPEPAPEPAPEVKPTAQRGEGLPDMNDD